MFWLFETDRDELSTASAAGSDRDGFVPPVYWGWESHISLEITRQEPARIYMNTVSFEQRILD